MESIHFQHNALTAAEVTTRRLCRLHRVRLFSPALCRVKRGSKVIVQGESRVLATPQQLIVLPADVELEVINQPENGLFCSDLLSLTPELLTTFKTRYLSEPPPGRLTSLCAPVTTELAFMWQSVLQAVREGLSTSLQLHQTMGPLLVERQQDLSAQVRQLVMLSPAQAWSVSRVAKMLFLGESTLRRRLQQESQSFRQIVEEVRMAHALGQLQTTSRPIGEIAQNSGYQSGSRFTARFRQHYGLLPKHVR
ncbi:TPA: helix-turn-helix transcriptional regulator [Klebsiella variicola]|uniref:helix-turn-helix transcriptional regulator n=1 Tax=Klebsiella variicola TaxID=244366 RepID=UPI000D74D491|nr:helix-turn-helix transcriptional regulator [Klebsiella variicola]HCF8499297.1 helix-turn-helix transcriptional regulator [Klebsiella variicola subsp. variicola]MBC5378964.1 helix-turn-helix transcriptional regulator [Klebsiella variicola]MBZ7202869.1 helix-turn-helix domain-containing protein [Klebsiella variicola]PXK66641.1 AraC family transcriptional regulator [Klebsiella variicola]SXF79429.1 AraC/XylS family transcriptional regulator [Klebsiella variicola]